MISLPKRKSIRLAQYDYSLPGWYFVTICTKDRECVFGHVVGYVVGATRGSPVMIPNQYGKIVENVWKSLLDHHYVGLGTFQIMPNHVHFIVTTKPCRSRPRTGGSRPAPTLGVIVGLFKSECTKRIRQVTGNPNFVVWQRNYYEHIIRTEADLTKIRSYIRGNPEMWHRDRNNPKNWRY